MTQRALIATAALALAGCAAAPQSEPTAVAPTPAPVAAPEPAPAPAPPPAAAAEARQMWEFPFEFSAGKIFIAVKINSRGPFWFAMDTGSPPTVIDINLARELGIGVASGGRIGGAGEGTSEMGIVSDITLSFGGITLPARSMPAVDLNERLAPFSSRPVMGLIGNDFITSRVVRVDYANQKLTVWMPRGWEYAGPGTIIPSRHRGYTFVSGKVALGAESPGAGTELPARFLIDTGAGLGVSLNTPFVNKNNLLTRAGPKFKASVGWGLGGEVVHDVARLDFVELGTQRIERPVAALSQDKAGALAQGSFEALIGGDVLCRYTVIFDAARRRMILEPNSRAADAFEFDMSGISLGGNAGRGPLVALRVRADSPAAEAGVREGDEILAVDGREVTGADRDSVKELFRIDSAERALRLKRGGDTVEVRMKLRRLVRAGGALSLC